MRFKNREEAARLLAGKLARYNGLHPLVLAIPRGAVPMGTIIADALEGELDVVLVRKLGAPGEPELAVGSIDENGRIYRGHVPIDVDPAYLEAEAAAQSQTIRRRRALYSPIHPPIDPAHRIVIVVDDGVATGASMIAALRATRSKQPKQLVAAMAVAPPETLREIAEYADKVVCLASPENFYAVGQFFEQFYEVSDEDVAEILTRFWRVRRDKLASTR